VQPTSVSTPTVPATASAATTTTPAVAAGPFDSCTVVTQAEAASALGSSVSAAVEGTATVEGGRACVFYGPSSPADRMPNVAQPDTVRVVVVEGSEGVTYYNQYKARVPAQAVAGLGDQAFYDGSASLSILKGDAYLRIAVAPAGSPPSLTDEKQLASVILPKI